MLYSISLASTSRQQLYPILPNSPYNKHYSTINQAHQIPLIHLLLPKNPSCTNKMQSILSIHSSFGLPLCVSGITHRLDLSFQIVDHDLRREALKKQRSLNRERLLENPDMGSDEIISIIEGGLDFDELIEEEDEDDEEGDLDEEDHDHWGCICAAKAA